MKKRILSILCVVAMLALILPTAVSAETIGELMPFNDFESYETGAGMGASVGYDYLRNNSTTGSVNIQEEENGNKYLYAANAAGNGCNLVYYSSTYTLAAKSSLEIKTSVRTLNDLNSIAFYFRSGLSGTLNSFNFLTISADSVKIHRNAMTIPVPGYRWTAGEWHNITYRWNYATGYAEITIECNDNVYSGSIENVGATIGSNTMGGIEIVSGNVLNIDNMSIANITAPFVSKTFIDDDFEDLATTGWTNHANGTITPVEYDGRKCLRVANDITPGYYQPYIDCADINTAMQAVYLETDFKVADTKGGFDIRFRDAKDVKMFNVSAVGKTEVPYCGNMFVSVGEDAGWYKLKLVYDLVSKNAYVNISNDEGVNFTSFGNYAAGPSNLLRLELVVWSGATVYVDNIFVKNIKSEDVSLRGLSKYFSFDDLETGDIINTADKADGSSAYYGWRSNGEGTVSAVEIDGRKAAMLNVENSSDLLVCEKYVLAASAVETDFMIEDMTDNSVSLQVAGSAKSYSNIITVSDGKIKAGETELCDYEESTWYRAVMILEDGNVEVYLVNLSDGATYTTTVEAPAALNSLSYFGFNVTEGNAKVYVDNFAVSNDSHNAFATLKDNVTTVASADGVYILTDARNINASISTVLVDGQPADFDATPWYGIKIKNLPENQDFSLTYTLKDYEGNHVAGCSDISTVGAYSFSGLDLYDENGDVKASVNGKVNAYDSYAMLMVAVYTNDGKTLSGVGVKKIEYSTDNQDYVVKAGINDYDSDKYTIAAYLLGKNMKPISAIK